ncbi:MAG: PAAR domain-containing protein [Gemmatimonadetes bacterium]|nr:PAAR domain-containing protein [Gemmatimonadota bacterium]
MKPAARLTDMHMCPMVTPGLPPIPHVGGPISGPGAMKTLIAGLPAARVGDMCVCIGPPDSIIIGSFTCLIEDKPAARMGDQCAHGGMITLGCPTVLIGNSGGAGSPQGISMSAARASASPFVCTECNKAKDASNDGVSAGGSTFTNQGRAGAAPSQRKSAWIEVEVVDERGKPLQGELVRVTDADGAVFERFSGPTGLVRVDGIAEGNAKVTLPKLDQELWKRA